MAVELSDLQKRLCDVLQTGLPACPRPFAEIADILNTDENTVLAETSALRRAGVIRRLGAILDYRALGKVSTLVTAHVGDDVLDSVARTINSLPGVSHNYLRQHHYNLWFTLQADSSARVEETLASLAAGLGVQFHSLPAVRFFKLDVRFNLSDMSRDRQVTMSRPEGSPVVLDSDQKAALAWLQDGIEITAEPFVGAGAGAIRTIDGLIAGGVIKRIAASLDYRALGFTANVMFCCHAPAERVEDTGARLASMDIVSHCYERRTFPGWNYNLFAMMHGRGMDEIHRTVSEFAGSAAIEEYALLPTIRELKKAPVRQTFRP